MTRTITVEDTLAPEITILGPNPITLEVGSTLIDPGAMAVDDCDGDLTGGIVLERSTDPLEADDPRTEQIETAARHWLSFNGGVQIDNHHLVSLFYGRRRGGPACTAGICYEVLDFEGFELRWTTTF